MRASIVLTVAQGKRLIAKAVAQMPEVRSALADGMVAIGRGTTNAYVVEEILGEQIPKGEYVAGRTLPPDMRGDALGTGKYPDVVFKKGARVDDLSTVDAVAQMKAGDVFIKGGNALNYERKIAGVLIGHPMGGTIGGTYGAIISRKVHLIIPIGLEKLVYEDLETLSRDSRETDVYPPAPAVSLFPMTGIIVTEIEAFEMLCGVRARLLSAGGVAGAEGAIWLMLEGDEDQLDGAMALHESLKGEPNLTGNK